MGDAEGGFEVGGFSPGSVGEASGFGDVGSGTGPGDGANTGTNAGFDTGGDVAGVGAGQTGAASIAGVGAFGDSDGIGSTGALGGLQGQGVDSGLSMGDLGFNGQAAVATAGLETGALAALAGFALGDQTGFGGQNVAGIDTGDLGGLALGKGDFGDGQTASTGGVNVAGKGDFSGVAVDNGVNVAGKGDFAGFSTPGSSPTSGTGSFAGVGTASSTVAGGNNPAEAPGSQSASNQGEEQGGDNAPAPSSHGATVGATVGAAAASGGGMALGFGSENADFGGGVTAPSGESSAGQNGFGDFGSVAGGPEAGTLFDMTQAASNNSAANAILTSVFGSGLDLGGPWPQFSTNKKVNPYWKFSF